MGQVIRGVEVEEREKGAGLREGEREPSEGRADGGHGGNRPEMGWGGGCV